MHASVMYLAIGVGYVGAVLLSYFLGRRLLALVATFQSPTKAGTNVTRAVGTLGGIIALAPALYLATVIGGTLGGGFGERATEGIRKGPVAETQRKRKGTTL
jgi:hypothetical protein